MAAKPAGEAGSEPLKYQTWCLKVPIHCEGCEKKVKNVLHSIDGVYAVAINSQQQKVTVTGDVDSGMLIRKLKKRGKTAEIWPEPFEMKEKKAGISKNNKKQNNPESNGDDLQKNQEEALTETSEKKRDDEFSGEEEHVGDEKEIPSSAASAGNGGQKKKKKGKQGNAGDGGAGGWSPAAREGMGPPVIPENLNPPSDLRVYQSYPPTYGGWSPAAREGMGPPVIPENLNPPSDLRVYQSYPPTYSYNPIPPAYGVSHSVAHPFATSSYYDTHVHDGFMQPRFGYLPPQASDPIRPFRYQDGEDDDGIGCSVM